MKKLLILLFLGIISCKEAAVWDKQELGRHLFYETKLSGSNQISCGSCHQQQLAFTDGKAVSLGSRRLPGTKSTMSLTNLEHNHIFLWDGSKKTIEAQIFGVLQDSIEMDQNLKLLPEELKTDYAAHFQKIYTTNAISDTMIVDALSSFVRSLKSNKAPIDALFQNDRRGYITLRNEFLAQFPKRVAEVGQLCESCHSGSLYGGTQMKNNGLDSVGGELFKAVSLRNIEFTAPYMHDGRFKTLEEVIDFYNEGIQPHPELDGILKENGKPLKLGLNDTEKKELIRFLYMLSDSSFLNNPAFSNPFEE